ncbi:MAG: restriction endonuclease subunit S [Candidatus Electrothrix sp. ATG2]|nr:restriction endonuclease subunit S [Candidatus Electrothrix sp. ATG2]
MKPYPNYKDSGVEWIGAVPEHWESVKLKYSADVVLGKMLVNNDKGGMFLRKYLRAANLQWFSVDVSDAKEMWFSEVEMERLRLQKDDLLMSEGGEVGRTCIWNEELEECYLQNSVHKITFDKDNNSKYHLYQSYLMGQSGYFDSIVNRISIAHLTGEKVKEVSLLAPTLSEQTAIAAFLDRKTAEIDKLIANKERLIELYEEEKKAVINQAVTKGLDPGAEMKDSGVEWLGEIPAHWKVKRINSLFSESNAKPSSETELNYPFLTISIHHGISNRELKENELDRKVTRSEDKSLYKIVQKNYLAYNMMRAWQGGFGASKLSGLVSPAYVICKPRTAIDSYFFELVLRTPNAIAEMRRFSRGIVDFRLRLYWDDFKNIVVPVPPAEEIKRILDHIETVNSTFSRLSSLAMRKINLFKEYRTALISEVVTGKIDVREREVTTHR